MPTSFAKQHAYGRATQQTLPSTDDAEMCPTHLIKLRVVLLPDPTLCEGKMVW